MIREISEQENVLIQHAEKQFGEIYKLCNEYLSLTRCAKNFSPDSKVFSYFISQFSNGFCLSVLSIIRRHITQATMMIRQSLEASILACYSLVHVEENKFGRINEKGCLEPNKKLHKIAYEWIESNFPDFSSEIKRQKDSINELFSHSNIVTTQTNIIEGEKKISALVFDSYPDSYIKVILWKISNNINSILRMYIEINKISNKVIFKDNLENKLNSLFVDLNKLNPILLKELVDGSKL